MPFYSVKKGHKPGVYNTWPEVQTQIKGYNHPVFKKFETHEEAKEFCESSILKTLPITDFFKQEPKIDPVENDKTLICFTDGSTLNNGSSNAKGAFGVVWPFHPELNHGEIVHPATNNRCEYSGVIHAIMQADILDPIKMKTLIVYTDSMLLINSLTKWLTGWRKNDYKKSDGKPVMNLDLIKILEKLISERNVVFRHVKAHTGGKDWESIQNDKVDVLAKQYAVSQNAT